MPTNNYDKVSNEDIGYWGNRIGSEYMDLAKNLYNKNINSEISNSSLDHAMLLSFLLIRKSQDKIRIFTKKMNETFFRNPEIRREIEHAIERDVEISIVVSCDVEDSFSEFKNKKGITIHKLNQESDIKNHFLLSDNTSFRIEEQHTDKDISEGLIKGFANFNDPALVAKISNIYDNILLRDSEEVS